jgi:D-sedoheptulose 7-phosphate isomerase
MLRHREGGQGGRAVGSKDRARRLAEDSVEAHRRFAAEMTDALAALADLVAHSLERGAKLLFFGNGGSASQAEHLAGEFVNRFERDRQALPALALTVDGSLLTSIANDDSYDRVFARQIEALGRPGDIAVGLTTSGTSPSVVQGLRTARERGLVTVAFSGRGGGPAAESAQEALVVPGDSTARIQEIHLLAGHILCALVDARLFPSDDEGADSEE